MKSLKLTACAALLAAITTTAAHANLVVQGTPVNDPLSFSVEFLLNPGAGGGNTYTSPLGANWTLNVTLLPGVQQVGAIVQHAVWPHGSPESPTGPTIIIIGSLPIS